MIAIGAPLATGSEQDKLKALQTTARSLDELVSQEQSEIVVFSQGRSFTQKGPSFDLKRATPILSRMLKIERPLLHQTLQRGSPTLSKIAYARVLQEKTGQPWQQWAKKSEKQLLREMQRQSIPIEAVHSVLKNVYTEMAFLSLDTFTETDKKQKVSSR